VPFSKNSGGQVNSQVMMLTRVRVGGRTAIDAPRGSA